MAKNDTTDPKAATEPAPKGSDPDALSKALAELDRLGKLVDSNARKTDALEEENARLRAELEGKGSSKPAAPSKPTPAPKRAPDGLVPGRIVHYMKAIPFQVARGEPVPVALRGGELPRGVEAPIPELEPQAALVLRVHEDGAADLKVFFATGAEHTIKRVPYADEPTKGAWSWPARA